jgi:hypothetical protein
MARSVALSPQFGNTVVFGSGLAGRRRRPKSVHVPLPEGLRVVAVCVPEEVDEAPRSRAARRSPHRTTVAARRAGAAGTRSPSERRAELGAVRSGVPGAASDIPAAGVSGRAGPPRSVASTRVADTPRRVEALDPAVARPSVASARKPQQAKLRLTRRGQLVLTLLVTGLLLAVFSLGRFSAGASGDPVPHRTVVVHTGDTLWSIAAKAAPSADPRVTVEKIRLLNHLDSGGVQVGQQLQLP